LNTWDYAEAIFRSEQLQISCPKTDTGTNHNIIWRRTVCF